MQNLKRSLIIGAAYALPALAFAQGTSGTLVGAANTVADIFEVIVPILGALILIYFFVGAIQYVSAKGDEEARTEARNRMVYAVIGMFVAFSIFGLIALLRRTFQIGTEADAPLPGFTAPRLGF